MNISKKRLKEIIKEEINEISKKTEVDPGGFEGIIKMAEKAALAADNLETKIIRASKTSQDPLFQDEMGHDIPEELVTVQRYIDSIRKAAMWQTATGLAPTAFYSMKPEEYESQYKRLHTPAYKRDEE
jgi:hypothetical protein